ncbi:hypothetical protein AB4277_07420 [Vibrio splendidus]|nr:hypothetical protein [Vibrio splendidus]
MNLLSLGKHDTVAYGLSLQHCLLIAKHHGYWLTPLSQQLKS